MTEYNMDSPKEINPEVPNFTRDLKQLHNSIFNESDLTKTIENIGKMIDLKRNQVSDLREHLKNEAYWRHIIDESHRNAIFNALNQENWVQSFAEAYAKILCGVSEQ